MTVDDKLNRTQLTNDLPRTLMSQDEFGLSKIVEALADTLANRAPLNGFVLGIQGSWGSGKSTFVNFVLEHIQKNSQHNIIIRFDPWLVGANGGLLPFFIGQLAREVDQLQSKKAKWYHLHYWAKRFFKRTVARKIKRYGEYAAALSKSASSAAMLDHSGATLLAAAGLSGISNAAQLWDGSAKSLDILKAEISREIKCLKDAEPSLRITVIIDDTDRLEPIEAAEILRLVRKVADFPLVSYVICFDRRILNHQIEEALRIKNGDEYIEKIFQSIVAIPPQEPFALRRYLRRLLLETFSNEMRGIKSDTADMEHREHLVLDIWAGALITTPRDVTRLYEAIKFGWRYLPNDFDFLDFVWLQMIKLKSSSLYEWTQSYLSNIASYRDGGRPGDNEPKDYADRLHKIIEIYGWDKKAYRSGLDYILPGVHDFLFSDENRTVFKFKNQNELSSFEQDRRLGSPSHWRRYFSFSMPSYALSDELITSFRQFLSSDPALAASMMIELLERNHSKRGHFVDVLLDRLYDIGNDRFSPKESQGIAIVFARVMDQIAIETEELSRLGDSAIWRKAARLLNKNSAQAFGSAVEKGESINWIAHVLRDQGFAHGIPDQHRTDSDRQFETKDQLLQWATTFIERLKLIGFDAIFQKPAPLSILFCWLQMGNAEELRTRLATYTSSTRGLLNAVGAIRSWQTSSSTGLSHPIRKQYVAYFLDADAVHERLVKLSMSKSGVMRLRAQKLLSDWTEEI